MENRINQINNVIGYSESEQEFYVNYMDVDPALIGTIPIHVLQKKLPIDSITNVINQIKEKGTEQLEISDKERVDPKGERM